MKVQVLDKDGRKEREFETKIFSERIRKDIIQKSVEQEKQKQPFAPSILAGKQASASGKTRHTRRKWKTAAGHGISRVPRKIFWRRGTQFNWEAATVASARGGRRAHPPKILSMINVRKINKKEKKFAFFSALALTASLKDVKEKYSRLKDKNITISFPLVVDSKILGLKTKEFFSALEKILKEFYSVALQKKSIRAGKGKIRGRKHKKSQGLLLVTGGKEAKKIQGVECVKAKELTISDLVSGDVKGARVVMYTEQAVKDIEDKFKKSRDKIKVEKENKK